MTQRPKAASRPFRGIDYTPAGDQPKLLLNWLKPSTRA